MMLAQFPSDTQEESQPQCPAGPLVEALPLWQESGELSDHRECIFHFHTMMCPQFANGTCSRSGADSRSSSPQCFCYHFQTQRRRPLVDTLTGQLRYWDLLCDYVAEEQECPYGDLCPFAHTQEEVNYHAAKYKTKLCDDPECCDEDSCCLAHGESELRATAQERYSFWSAFGGGVCAMQGVQWSADMSMYDNAIVASNGPHYNDGRGAMMNAQFYPQAVEVYKHRFCASYPHVASCRRGEACAFAHSREEIRLPLLTPDEEDQRPSALTNEFFMHRFKTLWCPIGVQHDWQTCVYAHNYQDARRHPAIGYGPRPCPHWKRQETSLEYSQRCPLGVRCPYSHGAKEQLYHPAYFKTVTCQDSPNACCPRGKLCAFWHKRSQQRSRPTAKDEYNYKVPINEEKLCGHMQKDFLSPPFKMLNALQASMQEMMCMPCDGSQDFYQPWGDEDWSRQMCAPNGAVTPTTQTTQSPATDTDEAGSASGSDKVPPVQDEEGGEGMAFGSISGADLAATKSPQQEDQQNPPWQMQGGASPHGGAMMGQPWGAQVCFGEGMVMPGYLPAASGDCNNGQTQMMFYMPMPSQMAMAPMQLPMGYEIMVPVDTTNDSGAVPTETTCTTPRFEEIDAVAPVHNGFVHVKEEAAEDDSGDDCEPPVGRRQRALSL